MVYVFLANGFEEVEAVAPIDLLRRCELSVVTVGVGGTIIKGSHGIPVFADIEENEIQLSPDIEMLVLPGGMPGTLHLESSQKVQEAINYASKNNIPIAAICAAPSILGHKGLLAGKKAVCAEGFEEQLFGATVIKEPVCVDGKFITARGAGVAIEFALKLVEILVSTERSNLLGASIKCVQKQ